MRRRTIPALFVVLFCSAFQARGFAGCGGGPPTGGELPIGGDEGCFVDSDCAGDPCRTRSCLGGRCVDVGILDLDGDGVSPAPCGMDCDDTNVSRYPGALEACDGLDQDCDGGVDEEATPAPLGWRVSVTGGPSAIALREGSSTAPEILLTDVDPMFVTLRRLDVLGGALDSAVVGLANVTEHDLVRGTDGSVTLVALAPAGATLHVSSIDEMLGAMTTDVPVGPTAAGLVAAAYAGGVAAAWIEGGSDVRLWTSELAAPVSVATVTESGTLGLSGGGTALVLAVPSNRTLFLDPSTGTPVAMRTLDAPRTWAAGPLAGTSAATFGLVRDAFDLSVTRLDPAAPLRFTPAPSVPDTTMPGRVDAFGSRVLITRFSDGTRLVSGTQIGLLDIGLVLRSTFDGTVVGPGGATGWDVAMDDEAIVVAVSFFGEVGGLTLYCGSR